MRFDDFIDADSKPWVNWWVEFVHHQLSNGKIKMKAYVPLFFYALEFRTQLTLLMDQKSMVDPTRPAHRYSSSTPFIRKGCCGVLGLLVSFKVAFFEEILENWPHCNSRHVSTWSVLFLGIRLFKTIINNEDDLCLTRPTPVSLSTDRLQVAHSWRSWIIPPPSEKSLGRVVELSWLNELLSVQIFPWWKPC